MMKKIWAAVPVVVFLLLGFGLFVKVRRRGAAVETARVERKDLLLAIEASGEIEASRSAELKFETPGKIVWLPVKEGDRVEKWQGVAALDRRALRAAFDQARASWVKYVLQQEQTTEDYEDVWHDPAIRRTTGESQATVDYYWSALQAADLALKKAVLTTPLSGTVVALDKELGEYAAAGEVVLTVADLSNLYFAADLDETDVGEVKVGQTALFSLDAFPEEKFKGVVGEISPRAGKDENGETVFRLKIYPDESSRPKMSEWRLGMSGDVEIVKKKAEGVLVIPFEAVGEKEGQTFVYVVEAGRLKRREIELGLENETDVEVVGGLEGEEKVVVSGLERLKEGLKVAEGD